MTLDEAAEKLTEVWMQHLETLPIDKRIEAELALHKLAKDAERRLKNYS